jgi:hypothetical protein
MNPTLVNTLGNTLAHTRVEPYTGCPRLVIPRWAQGGAVYPGAFSPRAIDIRYHPRVSTGVAANVLTLRA